MKRYLIIKPLDNQGAPHSIQLRDTDQVNVIVERWQKFWGKNGNLAPCEYQVKECSLVEALISAVI
jgi:hypothetical protein